MEADLRTRLRCMWPHRIAASDQVRLVGAAAACKEHQALAAGALLGCCEEQADMSRMCCCCCCCLLELQDSSVGALRHQLVLVPVQPALCGLH